MSPLAKKAAAAQEIFDLGNMDNYSQGGGLPEGDYCLKDFTVQMYQAQNQQTGAKMGPPRLGVMITLLPLEGGEERTQFYSFGSNADKSFAPNPETGKSIVAVPGGPASTLNASTNWALFIKSMFDSGLPQGIFTGDFTVLDGVWVHMHNIPEPEERKGYQSQTGEAVEERKSKTIAVVSEIKEGGAPWEGGGGVPEAAASAKPAAKVAGKPAAKPASKETPAPAAPESNEDVEAAAISGVSEVLEKNPNGCPKLLLRTGTFKAVKTASGDEVAQAVLETYFSSDAALNKLLNQLGYALAAGQVKAQ